MLSKEELLVIQNSEIRVEKWRPFQAPDVNRERQTAEGAEASPSTLRAVLDRLEQRRRQHVTDSGISKPIGYVIVPFDWRAFVGNEEKTLHYLEQRRIPACLAEHSLIRMGLLNGDYITNEFRLITRACRARSPLHMVVMVVRELSGADPDPCTDLQSVLCRSATNTQELENHLELALEISHIIRNPTVVNALFVELLVDKKCGSLSL